MKFTKIGIILLLLLTLVSARPVAAVENPQTEDGKAYQAAYGLVMKESWGEALKALDAFMAKYPKSGWNDDARYWRCYTLEKSGRPLEEVFDCYQAFLKTYPDGSWADDAKANLVRIGSRLAKNGKPQYETMIKALRDDQEDEVTMAALHALADTDNASAAEMLIGLYNPKASLKMRTRLVSVLGESEDPKARQKIAEIARTDPSEEVRRMAVEALAENPTPESIKLLREIALKDASPEMRRNALFALAETDDPQIVPFLKEIALTAADEETARAAVYGLAEKEGPASLAALQEILKTSKKSETRRETLNALAEHGGTTMVPFLQSMALTDADEEIRRTAINLIAESKDKAGLEALKAILKSGKTEEDRRTALYAIAEIGGPAAKDMLLSAALTATDEETARDATFALAEASEKGRARQEVLLQVYRKATLPAVRRAALEALVDEENATPISLLAELLKAEKDPEVRDTLIDALAETKKDEAVAALYDMAAMIRTCGCAPGPSTPWARSRPPSRAKR